MRPHPFFVITATIGSHSDRRWWVVCVALDPDSAQKIRDQLAREAEQFNARREPLDREHSRRCQELTENPNRLSSEHHQQLYRDADVILVEGLRALKREMTDKKFPFSRNSTEIPEYTIVPTFDDPSEGEPTNLLDWANEL